MTATVTPSGAAATVAKGIDPATLPLVVGPNYRPVLKPEMAQALARRLGAVRVDQVDALTAELYRLGTTYGYNPDILLGMTNLETDTWRSPHWKEGLNPGGIGVTDQHDFKIAFASGVEAARAMVVHFLAYAAGHDNRFAPYIVLDPRFIEVHKAGFAGVAKTLADFGNGRWATDPLYAQKVAGRIRDLAEVIEAPTEPPTSGRPSVPKGLVQRPTGNWHHRHPEAKVKFVVHHITDDLVLAHSLDWHQNPGSEASCHFMIDRDGTAYQLVSTTRAAWTNGDVKNPRRDMPALNEALAKAHINMNDWCVTIEYVADRRNPPTEAQYRKGIEIAAYVRDLYGVPPHRYGQLRHSDINSVDRWYCPGDGFDLARVITALGGDPTKMAA